MSLITTPSLHTYERYYKRIEPILEGRKAAGYLVLILTFATLAFFGYFAIKPTLATIASKIVLGVPSHKVGKTKTSV